jgi:hypothetical protein
MIVPKYYFLKEETGSYYNLVKLYIWISIGIIITYPKLNNNNILIRGMLYYNTHNDKAPFIQKDLRTTCYH